MGCRQQLKPVSVMIAVNLGFAIVNLLLKKIVDEGINHMVIITYRQSISTIFLVPIAYYWERKTRPKLTFHVLCYLFLGALFGLTITQYLFLLGLEYTSATFSCAFLNMVPVNTFVLALTFGVEKVNLKSKAGKAKLLGALICMGGAVLLTLYKGFPVTNSHSDENIKAHADTVASDKKIQSWVLGSLFSLGGSITWSSWFLIQAKIGKRYPCQYSSSAILFFLAAVQSAVISSILERNIGTWNLKGKWEIITIIYGGVVASGLCYVGMSWCVKQRGPVFTAAFTPSTQIFTAMFDFYFLHSQIFLGSILGSMLVILGLYMLLWGKSIEAEECVMKQSLEKESLNGDVESQVPAVSTNPSNL